MPRHKRHESPAESESGLEVASLIDVCFLLLIYFIATSTISLRERDLDVRLPDVSREDSIIMDIEPLLIEVAASGAVHTGAGLTRQTLDTDVSSRELPLLSGWLAVYRDAIRAAHRQPLVRIQADDRASQQRVIDVLNALAKVGITAVTIDDLPGAAR